MPKRIIGNPTTTPLAMPDIDARIVTKLSDAEKNYANHKLIPSFPLLFFNFVSEQRIVENIDEVYDDYFDGQVRIPCVDVVIRLIDKETKPTPITTIPSTLEANKQYNFGEVTELALAFPTIANDGDVIYLTFKSGTTATTLTIDTTNTCDIEFVPEANTGYEIFGKYNGEIWIVNYSEYTVSEG